MSGFAAEAEGIRQHNEYRVTDEPTLMPKEIVKRLGVTPPVFAALARSGLLGAAVNGRFRVRAIEDFERYGTQWQGERDRGSLRPDIMELVGVAPGTRGGEQPPDTGTQLQVSPVPNPRSDEDTAWITQFYIRPNRFLLPSPTALSLIGPVLLRLGARHEVAGTVFPTHLFPDPEGNLAMLQVAGDGKPDDSGFKLAYDVAYPVLDALAVRFDIPLHVCQTVVIGVPSGVLTLFFGKPPKPATLPPTEPLGVAGNHPELREAAALYRDAISIDNVFHRFLGLYKAYENCCAVRAAWRRRTKRKDLRPHEEVFPVSYAFQGFEGLTFDQAKQRLNKMHRIALAHGDVPGGTPATGAEHLAVSAELAVVRYMARRTLLNVQATLSS